MLADPRSEALVSNFAGQWLHVRNVSGFRPSPELLFHFDDNLRQAFERERPTVLRQHHPRESQRARPAGRRLHVPQRASGQALRDSGRVRRTIQAGVASGRQRAPRAVGTGLDSDGYLAREPDLSGDPRQMDPREYFRHAAAAAAAERARAEGRRQDRGKILPMREQMAQHRANPCLRELPCADGPVGVRARKFRRDRRVARHRCGRLAD